MVLWSLIGVVLLIMLVILRIRRGMPIRHRSCATLKLFIALMALGDTLVFHAFKRHGSRYSGFQCPLDL